MDGLYLVDQAEAQDVQNGEGPDSSQQGKKKLQDHMKTSINTKFYGAS